MVVIYFIIEFVFDTIFGWVGYIAVKALTLGKVELEWDESSEAVLTKFIGIGVLLALAMLISLLIGYR